MVFQQGIQNIFIYLIYTIFLIQFFPLIDTDSVTDKISYTGVLND